MSPCKHKKLFLIDDIKNKMRCLRCHLTISEDELSNGFCPECYEMHGVRHKEFVKVISDKKTKVRYRCEECGLIVE